MASESDVSAIKIRNWGNDVDDKNKMKKKVGIVSELAKRNETK